MSKMALTNHNPSETNKHLTYTIGEDDLKDELRDQVPELYPN
jgi:hypothetical protein